MKLTERQLAIVELALQNLDLPETDIVFQGRKYRAPDDRDMNRILDRLHEDYRKHRSTIFTGRGR